MTAVGHGRQTSHGRRTEALCRTSPSERRREGLESAQPRRCRSLRRGSLNRTYNGHSGPTAGTGLHAPLRPLPICCRGDLSRWKADFRGWCENQDSRNGPGPIRGPSAPGYETLGVSGFEQVDGIYRFTIAGGFQRPSSTARSGQYTRRKSMNWLVVAFEPFGKGVSSQLQNCVGSVGRSDWM